MCYVGMLHPYGTASRILQKLSAISVTPKQIERVCTYYGSALYKKQQEHGLQPFTTTLPQGRKSRVLYVLFDGSFINVRHNPKDKHIHKDEWKEVKLARLIDQQHIVKAISKDRNYVSHSDYLAHIGNCDAFLEQLQLSIDARKFERLVFVCDGARWIWNWIEDAFAGATQILDYYHAVEHLNDCGKALFDQDASAATDWINKCQQMLLSDKVDQIIKILRELAATLPQKAKKDAALALHQYYSENQTRMYYKTYRDQGLEIGSGAIESANRFIIQQRAKLSGQRWKLTGAQAILTLRTFYYSNRWQELIELIKNN